MCDATFTFGQRGGYFFQCPSHRESDRLPRKLTTLLSSPSLSQIHHVALGANESFLLTWRDTKGADRIDSSGLPPDLDTFLYATTPTTGRLARTIPSLRLVLGPNNTSFFAHDDSSYLWLNLPPALLSAFESRIAKNAWTDAPRAVALGADDAFVLLTASNAAAWHVPTYPALLSLLSRPQDLSAVVLDPHRYGACVAVERSGEVTTANPMPHAVTPLDRMRAPVLADSKAKAKAKAKTNAARKIPERRVPERHVLKGHALSGQAFERRDSGSSGPRSSGLQQRAQVRKEWNEHRQEFTAQAKGLKLSLSLSVSAGGLMRMLG